MIVGFSVAAFHRACSWAGRKRTPDVSSCVVADLTDDD